MRLFIALNLPEEVRDTLSDIGSGLPGARWVPWDNLHLTLRFIGETDRHMAADIDDMLHGIDARGFDLTLEGVGVFTEGKRINLLWAGVQPNEALTRLQAKVDQAVVRAGAPAERRKFKPHVTLARGRIEHGPKLQDFLSRHALLRIGPFPVEDFTLFSSYLQAAGPLYAPEVVYPLEPRFL